MRRTLLLLMVAGAVVVVLPTAAGCSKIRPALEEGLGKAKQEAGKHRPEAVEGGKQALEQDRDLDGVPNSTDNCATEINTTQDNLDGDSFGDVCDPDKDGDGTLDVIDPYPLDSSRE